MTLPTMMKKKVSLIDLMNDAAKVLAHGDIDAALNFLKSKVINRRDLKAPASDADRLALLAEYLLNRDHEKSVEIARRAIKLDKECMEAWHVLGVAYDKTGHVEDAKLVFTRLALSEQTRPERKLHASNMLIRFGDHPLAIKTGLSAFEILGKPLDRISPLLYIAQKVADWRLVEELTQQLKEAYTKGQFSEAKESARVHLNWCANEAWNIGVISSWNERTMPELAQPCPKIQPLEGRKLRIGYLSSDYHEHPTARLVKGLFRNHDKTRIELILYCCGWDDQSDIRKEVLSYADEVHVVTRLSDQAAADLIRSHQIDVLVDLNGPTKAHRMGILAHRPAPVQIDYIGFPGCVGGRVVDYVVGDAYVMPEGVDHMYPEKLIRLDKTYQVNDFAAMQKKTPLTRAEAKLPERGFLILGMFNAIEKIHAEVWETWMNILKRVPNALIWMLNPGKVALKNIAEATKAHGVDGRRILIAPKMPQEQHLARLALCDLMLDPWPYGGHTTTSDALFAGVPVLALEGTNFASRVSGSLLHAAGLGALVASDREHYVRIAVHLLQKPEELQRVRKFVEERVPKLDVFDAKGKARQLEEAYHAAVLKKLQDQNDFVAN